MIYEGVVPRIKVLVVDDHEMMLESLVRLLTYEPDIEVVGVAGTVESARREAARFAPDVIVMDYSLPDGVGTDAARAIIERQPSARVLLLTGTGTEIAEFEASRAGCAGYLEKTRAFTALTSLIRDIHTGRSSMRDPYGERLPHMHELTAFYQPIVELESRRAVGFEALVRWNHPTRGIVYPDEFIPQAEQSSLIVDIDEWMRNEACRQAAEWAARARQTPVPFMSVNVSGRDLAMTNLGSRIEHAVDVSGLRPDALVVEVTETVLVSDTTVALRTLEDIAALGVRIALDDFGAGYSSLDYLRRFPIDIIKLDRYFTEELPNGARALQLVEAVGNLASDMNVTAEAEGVEREEQADCLVAAGWKYGQGYLYSRPLPSADMEPFLN